MKKKLTNRVVSQLSPKAVLYEVRDTEIKGFLLRVQPTGCMTYYFIYRAPDGKKNRIRLGRQGTITPIQARNAASVQAGKVAQGIDPQAEKRAAKIERNRAESTKLGNFINDQYECWATNHRKTGADTIRRIKTCFPFLLDRRLGDIDKWTIESWRSMRLKAGMSPTTINRDIAALRSVLTKALEWGIIDRHPLERLKQLSVDKSRPVRHLSPDEETRLMSALETREAKIRAERHSANQWRRTRRYSEYPCLDNLPYVDHIMPMVLLSLNTGMRRSEVFNLRWQHINLTDRSLTVVAENSKNGNTRIIKLSPDAFTVLSNMDIMPKTSDLVFPGKDGMPFNNVKTAWSKIVKDAGLNNFRWHDMRHHFASSLRMKHADLQVIKEILGHSDIKTTMIYANIGTTQHEEVVNLLTPYSERQKKSTGLRIV